MMQYLVTLANKFPSQIVTRSRLMTVSCLLLALGAVPASATNLIVNADFSGGNAGFTTDLTYSPGNTFPEGTYDITTDPSLPSPSARSFSDHTPTSDGLMLVGNGSTDSASVAWSQTVIVLTDTQYDFRFWANFWGSDASPQADLEVQINNTTLGVAEIASDIELGWREYSYLWDSIGPVSSATIELVNTSTGVGGNDFALDDMYFAVVPEPSTALLLGFGLVGLAVRRMFSVASGSVWRDWHRG